MKCCGIDMHFLEVFGIKIYRCSYRNHHPMRFVMDEQVAEEEKLEWQSPGVWVNAKGDGRARPVLETATSE